MEACWTVLVSVSGIGYGDIIAQTYYGRALIVMAVFLGIFFIRCYLTLIVVGRNSKILNTRESLVVRHIQESRQKIALRKIALNLLQRYFRYRFAQIKSLPDIQKKHSLFVDKRLEQKNYRRDVLAQNILLPTRKERAAFI